MIDAQVKHHRRSIRLKGHDYAGGGLYFITICAHRDAGDIFAPPAVKAMVGRVWEKIVGAGLVSAPLPGTHEGCHPGTHEGCYPGTHEGCHPGTHEGCYPGTHEGCPYVIMPDHFHGLIRVAKGRGALGDFIGAFKSLVVHDYIVRVRAGEWPRFPGKIWHRNYYECIVRDEEARARIAHYIRMNPWRIITEGVVGTPCGDTLPAEGAEDAYRGHPYRAIGNPALINRSKIGVFCSRGARVGAPLAGTELGHPYIGGFHSDSEKALLTELLKARARIICVPAWGIDTISIPSEWFPALEENRMLILEWRKPVIDGPACWTDARDRNAFVMHVADHLWIPVMRPGGMLERQVKALGVSHKMIRCGP